MYIYNIAFIAERVNETTLRKWILDEIPSLAMPSGDNPRIVELIEIEGMPAEDEDAINLSLQVEFGSYAEASQWGAHSLPTLKMRVADKFGEKVVVFATILKISQL